MQLIDTIVIIASMNTASKHHFTAREYLVSVGENVETFAPLSAIVEFDLLMKGRNYTPAERKDAFDWLSDFIPEQKMIPNSIASLRKAVELQEIGMSYFDSLISGLAIDQNALVLTPDAEISRFTKAKW